MSEQSELVHSEFKNIPIGDKCTWFGTTYSGEGKNTKLDNCNDETIGGAIFCDPSHSWCEYHSVCERHKGTAKFWGVE